MRQKTIHLILKKIEDVVLIGNYIKEIIIVNDCSKDETESVVIDLQKHNTHQ